MENDHATAPVFLITHEFYPRRGGIATFSEEMAKASAHIGYEVEVWAQLAPEEQKKKWPFRLRRLPLKGSHDLWCQLRLAWHLITERRRLRYATVYLPEPGPILAMMLVQFFPAFRPKRLILTFHGSEILRFHRSWFHRWLTRRLIRHAFRVSTLSHYTRNLLCHHFPEARHKVVITPGALRSDFAIVPSQARERGRKLIVLTVGRLNPRKGQLLTLRALQALAPEFRRQIEYWIVGGQNKAHYEETLRAQVTRSDLTVRFFGEVADEELPRIYQQSDIFAMTSVHHGNSIEGFGLVYLDASAHGLPVVGHSIGGVREAVINGVTGILVPPQRPAQLSAAFERLIADPALRRRLGDAGRIWAKRHQWAESAAALLETGQPAGSKMAKVS